MVWRIPAAVDKIEKKLLPALKKGHSFNELRKACLAFKRAHAKRQTIVS